MTSFQELVTTFQNSWIKPFEEETGITWKSVIQDKNKEPSIITQKIIESYFPQCTNNHLFKKGANPPFNLKLITRGENVCVLCQSYLRSMDLIESYSCQECHLDCCKTCYNTVSNSPKFRLETQTVNQKNEKAVFLESVFQHLENEVYHIPSNLFSAALFVPVLCLPEVSPLLATFKHFFIGIQYFALYTAIALQLCFVYILFNTKDFELSEKPKSNAVNLICLILFCFKMIADYNEIIAGFMWLMLPIQPGSVRSRLSDNMKLWEMRLVLYPQLISASMFHYFGDTVILKTSTTTSSILITIMLFWITSVPSIMYALVTPKWLKAANEKGLYLIATKSPENYEMLISSLFGTQIAEALLCIASIGIMILST
jgi:hypothetical protein